MTTYGLTLEGFVLKPQPVLRAELEARWKAKFGASIDTSDGSVDGQVIGIMCEPYALLWEVAEATSHSHDRDAVTGAAQDQLYGLVGCIRRVAKQSTGLVALTGDPGTIVPAGYQASVTATGELVQTDADSAAFTARAAWALNTAYNVGDVVTNPGSDATDRIYICITAGSSANIGSGPEAEEDDVTDLTVHWRFVGFGTAATFDVKARSVRAAPVVAVSGTIVTIETPAAGWSSVRNLTDWTVGRDVETHEDYRLRQQQELSLGGVGTPDAIRADVLELDPDDIESVTVFWNPLDDPDADGLPGHATEVLVRGGDDQEILDFLFQQCIASGLRTYGNTSGTVVDSEGFSHTLYFSRPVELLSYVSITVEYDPALFPTNGAQQIKEKIAALNDVMQCGSNGFADRIGAQAYQVAGVVNVPRSGSLGGCLIGTAPAPASDATIVVARRELLVFDTSRIDVTANPVTP